MIYLPDTNTINYAVKGNAIVEAHFAQALAAGATFVLSSFVHYEVTRYLTLKGATKQRRAYDTLVTNWPRVEIMTTDWDDAADLWAAQHRIGQPIDDADLLIAISALKVGATVVTNNTRHFATLGVPLENWTI